MKRLLFSLFCLPLLSFAEGDNSDVIQKINQESAYFTTLHAQTQGLINNLRSDISAQDYSEVLDNIYSCLYGQVYNYIVRNNNVLTSINNKFNPIDYSSAISSIESKTIDYSDYLQAIQDGQVDYTSNLSQIHTDLTSTKNLLSSVSSDVSSINDNVSALYDLTDDQKSILSSIDEKIVDYSSAISSIDSKLSDLGDISDVLTSIDDKIFDYSSSFQTANSRLSNISSLLSSIDSKIVDNSSSISSIDSKLTSVDDYFSGGKFYDDDDWSSFRRLFLSQTYEGVSQFYVPQWDFRNNKLSFTTSMRVPSVTGSYNNPFLAIDKHLIAVFQAIVEFNRNEFYFEQYLYNDFLPSLSSSLSSISSSVGDSLGSDVSQIQITLSDIKSLLENFDQGGGSSGGSEDPDEDPWIEFRETYLTLFDNQPIPTYEIDYALIGWETNSVATKETLTQTSGNFFDLCLAFAIDANKIAASESIFLHKILDYLPNLRPPEKKDTTEDETRIDTEITDVSGQISTLQETFNYEDLVFKEGATDFFDHDTITGQFDDESLPANVTIVIPPIFIFQTQVFNISTAGFADFFDYTRAFCAVLYYVLLCGFIWFVFKGFILCCTKFARVLGFVLQW